jgi:hypothetical protein
MELRACRNATIAALKFILSQQKEDGSFTPVEHGLATHNKLLLALTDMGQQPRAAHLASWLREFAMDLDGDFSAVSRPAPYDHHYPVANAFIAAGAMRLPQFSLAYGSIGFVTSLQHPETGGFLSAGPEAGLDDEQDLLSSAACGYACLQCGELAVAEATGRFLMEMWDNQPGAAAARLFLAARKRMSIITEFDPEQAAHYVVDTGKTGQGYHVPALAAGFLGCLYDATGEDSYLEYMHHYLQFLASCAEDRYSSDRSAWVGWASALAADITGNANYQRAAQEVAQGLLRLQLQNGSWLTGSMSADMTSDVVDATAEGIIVMNQIMRSWVTLEE